MLVVVVQPMVPAYRLPLFEALSLAPGRTLRVLSGTSLKDEPPHAGEGRSWLSSTHPVVQILGRHLYWQKNLRLPPEAGPGDVLVLAGNPRYLSNFPLLLLAKWKGMGVVWWGHGWSPTSKRWSAAIRMVLMYLADAILLYADGEVERVPRRLRRMRMVMATNNTVDMASVYQAQKYWDKELLDAFAVDNRLNQRKLLLFCGRLRRDPPSNVECALRALARLNRCEGRYVLAIVGCGPCEQELRQLSSSLGVADDVRWLGEIYDEGRLAPWFLLAQLFVYPGVIGLALLHAMSYGLPVITHDDLAAHGPEIHALIDGENGMLFRSRDDVDLGRVIATVCEDPGCQQMLAEGARKTIAERWNMQQMVERFNCCIAWVGAGRRVHAE